jgi:hypothetical protein
MSDDNKSTERVTFSRGYDVCIMAIDGTWRRACQLNAISDNDASLTVEGSIQGLNLKEFFLLLSSTGLAYRRCELVRVNGTEMDIQFLRGKNKKKRSGIRPGRDHGNLGPPGLQPGSRPNQSRSAVTSRSGRMLVACDEPFRGVKQGLQRGAETHIAGDQRRIGLGIAGRDIIRDRNIGRMVVIGRFRKERGLDQLDARLDMRDQGYQVGYDRAEAVVAVADHD